MKMITSIHLFSVLFTTFSCKAAEITPELYQQGMILYRKAVSEDVPYITALINKKAHLEKTKIVIVPKKFREQSVMSAVAAQKLYIAENAQDDIIAFKKLFVITDPAEFHAITHDEIRCDERSNFAYYNAIFMGATAAPKYYPIPEGGVFFSRKNSIVIYLGGDYTHPAYRNSGINSELTRVAFDLIKEDVLAALFKKDPTRIALLYFLTKENAGEGSNAAINRTPCIARAFMRFINEIATDYDYKNDHFLHHVCYHSVMPTFDPESEECIPFPDEHAVAGYGNVLLFPLQKK
jgi:hypothetical protein